MAAATPKERTYMTKNAPSTKAKAKAQIAAEQLKALNKVPIGGQPTDRNIAVDAWNRLKKPSV
jgi:hypothetical protein